MNEYIRMVTKAGVWRAARAIRSLTPLLLSAAFVAMAGCGTGRTERKKDGFFTSGSREADQRAAQMMARNEQLAGSGEGAGERKIKDAKPNAEVAQPAQVEGKLTLFDRLGGGQGLAALVDDFTPRILQDPRVDWQRKGAKSGGLFRRGQSVVWNSTPANVARLKRHLVQFLALATGGPPSYGGKEIKSTHADMRIGNPEFDAVIGDIKASLDKLKIPNKEQKELLAIIESTRPQIVTKR